MSNPKSKAKPTVFKTLGKGRKKLNEATAKANGPQAALIWHHGTITGLGFFSANGAGGREVMIHWDGAPVSRMQGGISDEQWEIFKLAFARTGRVAILSDLPNNDWMFDYRFLEAQP